MSDEQSMTMLYKATQGVVKETHYGLKLARVVPLPPGLVDHATMIAQKLEHHMLRKKKVSETVLKEKRRKLILNLKEHLIQAQNGVLEGEVLAEWLKELQKEFIVRMTALEAEAAAARQENEDEEMEDWHEQDREEQLSLCGSQSSIVTTNSKTDSNVSSSTAHIVSEASTVRAVSDNGCQP